jgi:WD40 repeat protein
VSDAATGEEVTVIEHASNVTSATFSPDSRHILATRDDAIARVWSATNAAPITPEFRHEEAITSATFSRDGRWVITASKDSTVRVWSTSTGEQVTPPIRGVGGMRFASISPDGKTLAAADDSMSVHIMRLEESGYSVAAEILLAETISASRIDASGSHTRLSAEEFRQRWEQARSAYPEAFRCSAGEEALWHDRNAAAAPALQKN